MSLFSCRINSIQTTGNVYVQTIEASVLNAMNSRTTEIFSARKPAILSKAKVMLEESGIPKRRKRSEGVMQQLDQLGPSSGRRMLVCN
jgi:hypothetical protein